MADVQSIYGRRTKLDDFLKSGVDLAKRSATAVGTAAKAVVPAIGQSIDGVKQAFTNTVGNNGPGGSGVPTYVAEPDTANDQAGNTGEAAINNIQKADAALTAAQAVPAIGAQSESNGVGVGYRPDTPMDTTAAMKAAGAGNIKQNDARAASLTASGFTKSVDAAGNETWTNGTEQPPAIGGSLSVMPAQPAAADKAAIPAIGALPAGQQQNTLREDMAGMPSVNTFSQYQMQAERLSPALWTDKQGKAQQFALAQQMMQNDMAKQKEFVGQQRGIADVGIAQQRENNVNSLGVAKIGADVYGADQTLAGHKVRAGADVEVAGIGAEGRIEAATAKQANDLQKKKQEAETKRYDKHFSNIKDLSLPVGFENKHTEVAKVLAQVEDPENGLDIYYAPGQTNRMGVVAPKAVFDPLMKRAAEEGYSGAEQFARANQLVKEYEKQSGKAVTMDFPNIQYLKDSQRKPADNPVL